VGGCYCGISANSDLTPYAESLGHARSSTAQLTLSERPANIPAHAQFFDACLMLCKPHPNGRALIKRRRTAVWVRRIFHPVRT